MTEKARNIEDEMTQYDLTNQIEQFLNQFLTSIATYSMRYVDLKQNKIDDAYHDWRQFLLYEQAFRSLIYNPEVSEDLIEYFDVQMPKANIDVSKNIVKDYIAFWQEFYRGFTNDCTIKQRKVITKALRQAEYNLEQDYGYVNGINR